MNNKTTIDKVQDTAKNALQAYSSSSESRALLNLIPIVGSAIDVWLSSKAQNIFDKRVRNTIKALTVEVSKIQENKVNKEFLQSEDFFDLLLIYFEKCFRTRNIEKLKINSKILAGSITIDNSGKNNFAEDMLYKFAELNSNDLNLAKVIYEKQKGENPVYSDTYSELDFVNEKNWNNVKNESHLSSMEFELALLKVSNAGLIKEVKGSYVGYFGGKYIITQIFKELNQYISYTNEPLFSSTFMKT